MCAADGEDWISLLVPRDGRSEYAYYMSIPLPRVSRLALRR